MLRIGKPLSKKLMLSERGVRRAFQPKAGWRVDFPLVQSLGNPGFVYATSESRTSLVIFEHCRRPNTYLLCGPTSTQERIVATHNPTLSVGRHCTQWARANMTTPATKNAVPMTRDGTNDSRSSFAPNKTPSSIDSSRTGAT